VDPQVRTQPLFPMWVSTTSVTDAGLMPAALSRWANFPTSRLAAIAPHH
jgi:hypothetical protein